GDRQELLRQIAFEEPRPPRRLNKAVPAELETIVLKALEKNPAERYATAQELADDLRRFLADEPIRARRRGLAARLGKWGRRNRAWVVSGVVCGVLVLLLAALGAAGYAVQQGQVAEAQAARAQEEERGRLAAVAAEARMREVAAAERQA